MRQGRRQFRPDVAGLEDRQLLSAAPAALSTVASFGTTNTTISPPVMDAQGDLFGTTSAGSEGHGAGIGKVYEIPAGTDKVEILASFNGRTGYLISGVSLDAQGNLYGTIGGEGGTIGNAEAFEIPAGTKTVNMIASFNGDAGQFPDGVVADAQGNLFGTVADGGVDGIATVYEIPAGSNSTRPVVQFSGAAPAPKGVVMDAQGNLYGTNQGGGADGIGSIYEVAKGSKTITTLATFGGLSGPGISSPTLDAQGNIYGTADEGGQYGYGTVFEIPKGSNTVVTLASFDGPNGSTPDASAGVVRDAQGNLYGITRTGGSNGDGTIFEIAAGSNTVTTLLNFTSTRQNAVTGLLLDGQGDLIGTTAGDGGTAGTVFKLILSETPVKS
jgi:uncharacterized repeat protein (TIGR03803 family)